MCTQWFLKINVFLRLWASHIPATVPIKEHKHASQKVHTERSNDGYVIISEMVCYAAQCGKLGG